VNRRGVGFGFVGLAAITYCTRYISAAIFGSGVSSWNSDLFNAMLSYIGSPLLTLSKVLAAVGIVYLLWGEWTSFRSS